MTKKLGLDEISDQGVQFGAEKMDNGELRFRLTAADGTAYIRTCAPTEGMTSWQNGHHHKGVRETYIVQTGWMAFADQLGNQRRVRVYFPGEVVTSSPNVDHNVFMPAGAVIHTVKHGTAVGDHERNGADWYPAEDTFNNWTRSLSIADIAVAADVSAAALGVN